MTCCEIAYTNSMLEVVGSILDGSHCFLFFVFLFFQLFLYTSLHNEGCLFNLQQILSPAMNFASWIMALHLCHTIFTSTVQVAKKVPMQNHRFQPSLLSSGYTKKILGSEVNTQHLPMALSLYSVWSCKAHTTLTPLKWI